MFPWFFVRVETLVQRRLINTLSSRNGLLRSLFWLRFCQNRPHCSAIDLHFHIVGNLYQNRFLFDPYDRAMDSARGDDLVALLHGIEHLLTLLLTLLLRTNDHEIEDDKDQSKEDDRLNHSTTAVRCLLSKDVVSEQVDLQYVIPVKSVQPEVLSSEFLDSVQVVDLLHLRAVNSPFPIRLP